jgi:formylglycine-generating enzyme
MFFFSGFSNRLRACHTAEIISGGSRKHLREITMGESRSGVVGLSADAPVFLSHSSQQKPLAMLLRQSLLASGIHCWLASSDIPGGEPYTGEIIKAIRNCRIVVVLLTEAAARSEHVLTEIERASHYHKRLLTFRMGEFEHSDSLEYLISHRNWVTFPEKPDASDIMRMVQMVIERMPGDDEMNETFAAGAMPTQSEMSGSSLPPRIPAPPLHAHKVQNALPSTRAKTVGSGPALEINRTSPPPSRLAPWVIPVVCVLLAVIAVVYGIAQHANRMADYPSTAPSISVVSAPPPQPSTASGPVAPMSAIAPFDAHTASDLQYKWAEYLNRDVETTNSQGTKLVLIPPGEFDMGTPESAPYPHDSDELLHRVKISKPFLIGATDVTVEQFQGFMKDSGYSGDGTATHPQGPNYPVVEVNWIDASAYCEWLSGKEGRHYRLPTESEWEFACRAGRETAFWWGDDPNDGAGCANCGDQTAFQKVGGNGAFSWSDGFVYTSPVGSFRANAFGLFDMCGNVWQWCEDGYSDYPAGPVTDPTGSQSVPLKVVRGGSWRSGPSECRCAIRYNSDPRARNEEIGFRVVLDLQ